MSAFKGQNVIVTGSTSGIGEATARLLVERGASGMLITGRHEGRGEKVAAELKSAGCNALFVKADLESIADCNLLFEAAEKGVWGKFTSWSTPQRSLRGVRFSTRLLNW